MFGLGLGLGLGLVSGLGSGLYLHSRPASPPRAEGRLVLDVGVQEPLPQEGDVLVRA